MIDGTGGNCFEVAGDAMLDAPASARLVRGRNQLAGLPARAETWARFVADGWEVCEHAACPPWSCRQSL